MCHARERGIERESKSLGQSYWKVRWGRSGLGGDFRWGFRHVKFVILVVGRLLDTQVERLVGIWNGLEIETWGGFESLTG